MCQCDGSRASTRKRSGPVASSRLPPQSSGRMSGRLVAESRQLTRVTSSAFAPVILRWLALLAAASWLGYFICSGVPQGQREVFRSTIALQAIALVPAVLYAGYLLLRRSLPGGSPLDWPLLLFVATYLVATVASAAWRVSLESTLILLMAVLVFYVLSDLHLLDATGLQRAFMLATAAASIWALWNVAGDYGNWLQFAKSTTGGFHLGDLIPSHCPQSARRQRPPEHTGHDAGLGDAVLRPRRLSLSVLLAASLLGCAAAGGAVGGFPHPFAGRLDRGGSRRGGDHRRDSHCPPLLVVPGVAPGRSGTAAHPAVAGRRGGRPRPAGRRSCRRGRRDTLERAAAVAVPRVAVAATGRVRRRREHLPRSSAVRRRTGHLRTPLPGVQRSVPHSRDSRPQWLPANGGRCGPGRAGGPWRPPRGPGLDALAELPEGQHGAAPAGGGLHRRAHRLCRPQPGGCREYSGRRRSSPWRR